jgi:tRNA nucleotidyltransferase (CCA-adding enzyme)
VDSKFLAVAILTITGKNPRSALQFIDRLGLYSTIFTEPSIQEFPVPETLTWHVVYNCLENLRSNETPGSIYQSLVRSEDSKYLAWILAALVPWSSVPQLPPVKQKGKPPLPLAVIVARVGIKADNKVCNVVNGAFKHYQEITDLKNAIIAKEPYINERGKVGMTIRRWDSQGGHWRLQALFALLVETMNKNVSGGKLTVLPFSLAADINLGYGELFGEWQGFIDHLENMEVMDAPSLKPILSGTELSKALGGVKPGPWMKPALDVCMEWQLRNPCAEDATGAIEEVKKRRDELKIPLVRQVLSGN